MATLEIGRSSSHCLSCNRGAMLDETGHYTEIGYSTKTGTKGCGEEWTAVTLGFVYGSNEYMQSLADQMKSDYPHLASLPWNWFKYPEQD